MAGMWVPVEILEFSVSVSDVLGKKLAYHKGAFSPFDFVSCCTGMVMVQQIRDKSLKPSTCLHSGIFLSYLCVKTTIMVSYLLLSSFCKTLLWLHYQHRALMCIRICLLWPCHKQEYTGSLQFYDMTSNVQSVMYSFQYRLWCSWIGFDSLAELFSVVNKLPLQVWEHQPRRQPSHTTTTLRLKIRVSKGA